MHTLIPAHAPASDSLAELNAIVKQHEQLFGPLADLDHDNAPSTVLRFAMTGSHPSPPTEVVLQVGGKATVPAGKQVSCQGLIFVAGGLRLAAGLRPKA